MRNFARCLLLTALFTSIAVAQLFQARLVSSGYAWQRQDTVGQSSNHFFGHQTIQFSLAQKGLSLHTYFQAFNDFAGPVKNDPQYRLYNLYFKARNLFDMVDVSVGRQMVFAGAGNGTIDGGVATLKLFDSKLRLTGYYGLLPAPRMKAELIGDRENNFMYGSQLIVSPLELFQFSASYFRRDVKPEAYMAIRRDSLFNPTLVEIRPTATAEEIVSGDIAVDYHEWVSAHVRYDYDVHLDRTSRMQFFARVKPFKRLGITGEYIYREPRISYNSIFWVFTYHTLNEYEVGIEYSPGRDWHVFGRYGSLSYGEGEQSQRVTVGGSWKYASASLSRNVGYSGEISAASFNAGYPLFERRLTPTLLFSYAQYKLSESATKLDNVLSAGVGTVYRPIPVFSVDAQLLWIQNKIYQNDVRLFVRASYLFSQRLTLF